MNAVPFELDDVYHGLAACHGIIRDDGDFVCLEFQVQDAVIGLVKSDVQRTRIPLDELASVDLKTSWFGLVNKLVIQVSSMDSVKDVPGMTQGRLVLKIARKDRDTAERFVAGLRPT